MSIPSGELAELLGRANVAAAPSENAFTETVIDLIQRSNIVARQDSGPSQFLRKVLDEHSEYLTPELNEQLTEIEIYGVDLPVINAIARVEETRPQIILFHGLLHFIHFYADLVNVLHLLMTLRPAKEILVNGETWDEARAFSAAGFAILAHFMDTGQVPCAVGDLLGPTTRRNIEIGYTGAVLFVLAHEAGHIALGHTSNKRLVAERKSHALRIDEQLSLPQEQELEADAFAFKSIREEAREWFTPSMLFFLGPFAFLEAFSRPVRDTHPLASNRAAQLAAMVSAREPENAVAIQRIVESQIAGFRNLAPKRDENNGNIRYRIRETMPIDLAYAIVKEVKNRVFSEQGLLDTREASDNA
jgi:hypothetical protein